MRTTLPVRYHIQGDVLSYKIPGNAVLGTSDTGPQHDSPYPSAKVRKELLRFRHEVLKPRKIKSSVRVWGTRFPTTRKLWLVVPDIHHEVVAMMAYRWLIDNHQSLNYVHDADLSMTQTNYDRTH